MLLLIKTLKLIKIEIEIEIPWFLGSSAWPLYVGIVVAGILGVPIGDWIHHRIDQTKFKLALGVLLLASGIVNIAKGVAELQQRQQQQKTPV